MLLSRPRIHSRSTSRSSIGRFSASFALRPQPERCWKGRRSSWIAHVQGRIEVNPARGIEVSPVKKRKAIALDAAQLHALADAVDPRYRALVLLLGYGGLRIGEACALRVSDVGLDGKVNVDKAVNVVNNRTMAGEPKTDAGRREVFLPEGVRLELTQHVARYCRRDDLGNVDLAGLLFADEEGEWVNRNAFLKYVLKPAAKKVGLDPALRTHDLRHTAASLMGSAGYSLVEAQAELGHTASTMTAHYSHAYD